MFILFLDILLRVLGIKPFFRLIKKYKALIIVFLGVFIFFLWWLWLRDFDVMERKKFILLLAQERPLSSSFFFFVLYFLASVLSLPGTTFLNIIGGFLFGFAKGTALSVFAVSIGSSIAFLITRFFLRDFFAQKGGVKIKKIYQYLQKDTAYYLFALRLFPFTPLLFTNIIMGLSSIKLSVFYMISFVSLLPSMAIYANVGTQLSQLEDIRGLAAPNLLFSFALIGFFPLFVKYLFKFLKRFKKTKESLPLESDHVLLAK